MMRNAILLAGAVLLGACSDCPQEGAWVVRGGTTDAYRHEIDEAVTIIGQQEGVPRDEWCGTVTVFHRVDELGALGRAYGAHDVSVVYSPAEGLGPAPGTTGIEHELCHAARDHVGDHSEDGANRCARSAFLSLTNGN